MNKVMLFNEIQNTMPTNSIHQHTQGLFYVIFFYEQRIMIPPKKCCNTNITLNLTKLHTILCSSSCQLIEYEITEKIKFIHICYIIKFTLKGTVFIALKNIPS